MKPLYIWALALLFASCSKTEEAADSRTHVITFAAMRGLEWTSENLSGFGGIEIDGNTYYTYDEAIQAGGKALGYGWRLPTQEEMIALDNLGSTWVDKGPHGRPGRWFGGNHATDHEGSLFFPAAGDYVHSKGSLFDVGSGYYWCYDANHANNSSAMSCLFFNSDYVLSNCSAARSEAFPARYVRSVE